MNDERPKCRRCGRLMRWRKDTLTFVCPRKLRHDLNSLDRLISTGSIQVRSKRERLRG
jgi:hypothetical protein